MIYNGFMKKIKSNRTSFIVLAIVILGIIFVAKAYFLQKNSTINFSKKSTNGMQTSSNKPSSFIVPTPVKDVVNDLDSRIKQKFGINIPGYILLEDVYPRYKINGEESEIPIWVPFMGIKVEVNNSSISNEIEKFYSQSNFQKVDDFERFYTNGEVYCDYQFAYPKGLEFYNVNPDNPDDPLRDKWTSITTHCSTVRDFFFWNK